MSGNGELLKKLGLHNPTLPVVKKPELPDSDEEIAGRCFGYLRGQRERALNLEFRRLKEGDSLAFPYSWLGPTRFDPSLGVLLLFVGAETYGVRIRGRNLNTLLDEGLCLYDRGILRHRITFVREMSKEESHAAGKECVIERIEITSLLAEQVPDFLGLSG